MASPRPASATRQARGYSGRRTRSATKHALYLRPSTHRLRAAPRRHAAPRHAASCRLASMWAVWRWRDLHVSKPAIRWIWSAATEQLTQTAAVEANFGSLPSGAPRTIIPVRSAGHGRLLRCRQAVLAAARVAAVVAPHRAVASARAARQRGDSSRARGGAGGDGAALRRQGALERAHELAPAMRQPHPARACWPRGRDTHRPPRPSRPHRHLPPGYRSWP